MQVKLDLKKNQTWIKLIEAIVLIKMQTYNCIDISTNNIILTKDK